MIKNIDIGHANVEEFNIARTSPKDYVKKIEDLIPNIQPNADGKKGFLYIQDKIPKITLNKGELAFREIIEKLQAAEPLNKLVVKKELNMEIPDREEFKNDYINELFSAKKEELKDTEFKNITCHYDIGSSNAAVSAALQVVDDSNFKGARRNNILNPDFKFIGYGNHKLKSKHYNFFIFAE